MKKKKRKAIKETGRGEAAEMLRSRAYDALGRGDYTEARKAIGELAAVSPREAASLLVSSYIEEGDEGGAKKALKELLALDSESVEAGFLEARVVFMGGNRVKTLERLKKLEKMSMPPAWQEKVWNLMGQCYRFLGDSQRAAEFYLKASQAAKSPELAALEYSNYLFNLHYLPPLSPEEEKSAAKGYDKFFQKVPRYYHRRRQKSQEKIKIGYISPDLRNHVVTRFSYALLTAYDKNRFIVYAYLTGKGDGVSAHLAEKVDGWRDVSRCTPEEQARVIYEDGIDILVDLSGHTSGGALPVLACKPAPIQVSGIGYFASTGLSAVDYFLGDPFLDDEETEGAFTEEILLLPRSHFCYTPFRGDTLPGEAPCVEKGFITFGSFNNFTKVNDEVLGVWARILAAVPGSRLLLKAAVFDYEDSREVALERIKASGIDISRVEVRGFSEEYLQEYREMDIALDTFPYPGGGTTCDALYMGVPVVTLRGKTHGGRFGYSILENVGLGELCAKNLEGYVERAVMLAGDTEFLSSLRQKLRGMMAGSPLMDAAGYMKSLEQGYEIIWEAFLTGQKLPSFREASGLARMMERLFKAGERQQALALADALLEAKTPSRDIGEKMAILYLDGKEPENVHRAVSLLPPDYAFGKFLRARAFHLQGELEKAEEICKDLVQKGGLPSHWRGFEYNLLAEIYKLQGRLEESTQEYLLASEASRTLTRRLEDYSNYLLLLQYRHQRPEFLFQESLGVRKFLQEAESFSVNRRRKHDRIRVGYLSPDFRRHVVACFSQAFFEAADRNRFEVYGYAKCREDDISRKMAGKADVWRNVADSAPEEIARIIREDEIDILVELAGHTGGNSLSVMALRPAPIQICGIGYFSTTGLSSIDYFLVDEYSALPGEEKFFTEKLLRLPGSQFCYEQVLEVPESAKVSAFEEKGVITFGTMNNVNKISDEVLEAWGHILQAVPGSCLFLKHGLLEDAGRREREIARLARFGIEPSRVFWEGFTPDYLKAYRNMDIALDTFPYPGGGTTCDALYMGIPVVSLAGKSNHERFGLSILSNVGLSELCASSAEEYVALASGLAKDRDLLRGLHLELRRRMEGSRLMNQAAYMRDLEATYEKVWEKWVN